MLCALGTLECHMPQVPESVHSGAPSVSKVHTDTHLMSKVHTFADLLQWGCLGSPLSIGWCSPSHVEVFHFRKLAPGHLSHWLAQTQHTWCPPLVYGQSPPSSMVGSHSQIAAQSLWWQHRQSQVGQPAAWKMLYIFVLLSAKEIDFHTTSDVRHQAADLCWLMECSWLTTVHLAWVPHWMPEFSLSWVLPLLCGQEAIALGSWQWWTDNSKAVSFDVGWYIYSL